MNALKQWTVVLVAFLGLSGCGRVTVYSGFGTLRVQSGDQTSTMLEYEKRSVVIYPSESGKWLVDLSGVGGDELFVQMTLSGGDQLRVDEGQFVDDQVGEVAFDSTWTGTGTAYSASLALDLERKTTRTEGNVTSTSTSLLTFNGTRQ